jgi:hypothetical protein
MGRAVRIVVAFALAGCVDSAHLTRHNAPGHVDLATPLAHENGDAKRFELPREPGTTRSLVVIAPYFLWGHGRLDASGASREVGTEVRFEAYSRDGEPGYVTASAWALTAGYGFAQYGDGRRTDAPGAIYGELSHRGPVGDSEFVMDVGLGPTYDLDAGHIGAQVTLRVPFVMVRTRYVSTDSSLPLEKP